MLELLVGVVDAELLKAVGLEVLESKDVEDADRQTLRRQNVYRAITSPMPGKLKGYHVLWLFCVRMCVFLTRH